MAQPTSFPFNIYLWTWAVSVLSPRDTTVLQTVLFRSVRGICDLLFFSACVLGNITCQRTTTSPKDFSGGVLVRNI